MRRSAETKHDNVSWSQEGLAIDYDVMSLVNDRVQRHIVDVATEAVSIRIGGWPRELEYTEYTMPIIQVELRFRRDAYAHFCTYDKLRDKFGEIIWEKSWIDNPAFNQGDPCYSFDAGQWDCVRQFEFRPGPNGTTIGIAGWH